MNNLDAGNCNKTKCKTCIFGHTPVQLTQERMLEIRTYLAAFEAAHICHTTDKTCYGALEFQSRIAHAVSIIEKPTVECFLNAAEKYLNIKQQ